MLRKFKYTLGPLKVPGSLPMHGDMAFLPTSGLLSTNNGAGELTCTQVYSGLSATTLCHCLKMVVTVGCEGGLTPRQGAPKVQM